MRKAGRRAGVDGEVLGAHFNGMRATYFLPAHASYFDGEYSQEEIETAIKRLDIVIGGRIFKGDASRPMKEEFVLLREPGKAVMVMFDFAGNERFDSLAAPLRDDTVNQYRHTSENALKSHLQSIKTFLEAGRDGR
jgi:hypothetical protein